MYSATIGIDQFHKFVCPCVRDPTEDSCVDLLESGLEQYMLALKNAIDNCPVIHNRLDQCSCTLHMELHQREDDGAHNENVFDLLGKGHQRLIEATCCDYEEQPMLCIDVRDKPPKLISWRCTHGNCSQSGNNKLQIQTCTSLIECEIVISVKEWVLNKHVGTTSSGKQNTQIELDEFNVPINEVLKRFLTQLMKCRKHSNETQWIALIWRIDINVLSIGFPLMFMDFPATCNLCAYMTNNSLQDAHAVLCIMVVLHSPRTITVNVNGVDCRVKLNECDVFHYFGDTISERK